MDTAQTAHRAPTRSDLDQPESCHNFDPFGAIIGGFRAPCRSNRETNTETAERESVSSVDSEQRVTLFPVRSLRGSEAMKDVI